MTEKSMPASPTGPKVFRRPTSMPRGLMLPLFIVLLALVVGLIEPRFWSAANVANLLRQLAPLLILTVGQALAIIGGGLDLSIAATLAAAGVVGVLAMEKYGMVAGMLAMLGTGIAIGAINGLLITKFRVSPFITTLGTMSVIKGLTLVASGGLPLYQVPELFLDIFGDGQVFGIPAGALIAFGCIAVGSFILRKTVLGRYIYAVGASPNAAYSAGVPTSAVTMLIYVFSGLMGGVAAIVMTSWVSAAQPLAGAGLELQAIAAAVIGGAALTGGVGKMSGIVCGAIILGMLSNGLNMVGVSSFYQTSCIGVIIIIAVVLDRYRGHN